MSPKSVRVRLRTGLNVLARDKHSSLFRRKSNYNVKSFLWNPSQKSDDVQMVTDDTPVDGAHALVVLVVDIGSLEPGLENFLNL